jgi:RHS repeat-associated protein
MSNHITYLSYDGFGRRVGIREVSNGIEESNKRYLWCGSQIWQERSASGGLTKRFFPQGVKIESGIAAGNYFYTKDHLRSIRELVDSSGTVRARYQYDPFGSRVQLLGNVDADFGFTGHFYHSLSGLTLAKYRGYDSRLGRWLSRDPLQNAEWLIGANLYAYVNNSPIGQRDTLGLNPGHLILLVCETAAGEALNHESHNSNASAAISCPLCPISPGSCVMCLLGLIPPPGPPPGPPDNCDAELGDLVPPCAGAYIGPGGGSGSGMCPAPPEPPKPPKPGVCEAPANQSK